MIPHEAIKQGFLDKLCCIGTAVACKGRKANLSPGDFGAPPGNETRSNIDNSIAEPSHEKVSEDMMRTSPSNTPNRPTTSLLLGSLTNCTIAGHLNSLLLLRLEPVKLSEASTTHLSMIEVLHARPLAPHKREAIADPSIGPSGSRRSSSASNVKPKGQRPDAQECRKGHT